MHCPFKGGATNFYSAFSPNFFSSTPLAAVLCRRICEGQNSLMKWCYKTPFSNNCAIAGGVKNCTAECARSNACRINKTLNGYRKYRRGAAIEYIRCSIVIVIIKSCLLCSKIKLIAIQSHRQIYRHYDACIN